MWRRLLIELSMKPIGDAVAEKLDQFLNGKTNPEISWASFDDAKVQGAFIAETNTILISEELQGSSNNVKAVVLEEIGHWLEQGNDSVGDEGRRFAESITQPSQPTRN